MRVLAAAGLFAAGCAGRPEAMQRGPDATASQVKPSPPPASSTAEPVVVAAAPVPPVSPPGQVVIVHQADLHGKVKRRAGKHVTIEPLVATSMTLPEKGNKGALLREIKDENGVGAWVIVAEVVVASTMVLGKNMDVDIVDENRDALVKGQRVNHFAPGTIVRLRWEW